MDKIIDAILKLIPFSKLFELLGLTKETSAGLSVFVSAILIYIIVSQINKLKEHYKNSKIASDLFPYFEYTQVKKSRDLFIPTRFQNNSPSVEDEPGFSNPFVSKSELIPHFLKVVFNEKKETDKFFLILADSGMGKTTFMINLYVAYNSLSNFGKYKIKLFPFGDSRILKQIEEIAKKQDDAKNTILLLDAFDEYKGLLPQQVFDGLNDNERFRKCLDEIVELTRDFREVIITSRTQYFPGQENQAYELKVPRFDEKGFHTLAKLYLSPFDDMEVKKYLDKKYGRFAFWNRKKKQTATSIVKNCPKLMVRPMLLAYIDYLVDGNPTFTSTYTIYEKLIQKWIEREANKRKSESTTREKFKKDLYEFSMLVALKIFDQQKNTGSFSIDKVTASEFCKVYTIELEDYEITGQSLLTRDSNYSWKFSHKSILEFFLAKKCIDDFEFSLISGFAGMDTARKFYSEVKSFPIFDFSFELIKGGIYKLDNKYPVIVGDFYLSKYLVTQTEYVKTTGKANPSNFKDNDKNPVENVSWFEAIAYCNLLNVKAGFAKVYDKDGNLLDKDGNITTDITKVKGFRLPTEAEWVFAAGGGAENRTIFAGTNNENELGEYAWYDKNRGKTHPVGLKKPNQLGLFDMSGNVWEWCYDRYDDFSYQLHTNPIGSSDGPYRVVRCGSWLSFTGFSRVAYRSDSKPGFDWFSIGFRVLFTSDLGQGC